MTKPEPIIPTVLGKGTISAESAEALFSGGLVAIRNWTVFEVTGPGAVACVQGVLTNDVEVHGEHSFTYGAVLTPKGMIIADMWAARDRDRMLLYAPAAASEALTATFAKFFPPRLAKVTDVSGSVVSLQLIGPEATSRLEEAEIELPEPGHLAEVVFDGRPCLVQMPIGQAPFVAQLHASRSEAEPIIAAMEGAGFTVADEDILELARIVSGWPRLGAEIDHKTLPQEVRFDEIHGVSYTKGCYTGQETVARIHFRGHPNKELMGLTWEEDPSFTEIDITQGQSPMGRVSSIAWLPQLDQYVGLGIVKSTVDVARPVTAANASATITPLPFPIDD